MESQTPPLSSASKEQTTKEELNIQFQTPKSSSSSPFSAVVNIRLWGPAAQRNLRNQWSKLASLWQDWQSCSSATRSQATTLVNSYLSQKYMDAMDLGILSGMLSIRKKASSKLFKQQVGVVTQMVNTSRSMRCYLKGTTNSPLAQFSLSSENENDTGDGGGAPVFTFWPISLFEKAAQDLVQIFVSELNFKRLLVMELLSLGDERIPDLSSLCWSDELYPGEFDDLRTCSLYSHGASKPVLPSLGKGEVESFQPRHQQDRNVLQIYLTTLIAEVNVERSRVDEIFASTGAEMHVTLS
ncbi:uncharacterized protein [Coffea arabica]|uniref:Uncharacterized protein isoform X3 n=1 Tax=Coffea arabica TaxID=13443 RepID=A0A6P6X738_COFAR|nr:uncharacterized protein LOC113740220 isoform X2 [Coffea arabica]